MTNREAAQKLYFLLDQWLTDFKKAEWLSKRTGRTREAWQTFISGTLFKFAHSFPTSDMIEEFLEWGWVLYKQLWAANARRTRFDMRTC